MSAGRETGSVDVKLCATCKKKQVPRSNRKHCSIVCKNRAADLRRRGLPTTDEGYQRRDPDAGLKQVKAAITSYTCAGRTKARRDPRWKDYAEALHEARDALSRAIRIKQDVRAELNLEVRLAKIRSRR